jgi:hypothetical protein
MSHPFLVVRSLALMLFLGVAYEPMAQTAPAGGRAAVETGAPE